MMSEFEGFPKPTYTQVPNELLDEFMPVLSGAELKVALFVARKTFGWHKDDDNLSISQIVEGTGLSRPAVCTATDKLVKRGLLIRREGIDNTPHNYRLNVTTSKESLLPDSPEVVKKVSIGSKKSLLGVVKKVNSQKKGLNKEKERVTSDANAPTAPAPKPSRTKTASKRTAVQAEPTLRPAPPSPEQAAASAAAWDAVQAAPPEARGRVSDDSTDPEALAAEIAHECGLDMRVTRQKKAALFAAQEISKAGATVGQVKHDFHHHWRTNVYRGMCGELARPIDLVNEWGRWQYITTPPARPNGAAPRPPLDYDQMLREAEARTANTPPLDPTVFPPIIPAWKILSQSA